MIKLRGLWLAVVLLCAVTPAHAQKTKAAVTTDINANWPDNTSAAITPALLRSTVLELVNSYFDANGGSSLACAAHQWVAGIPTLSSLNCTQPGVSDLSGFGTNVAAALGNALNGSGGLIGFSGIGSVVEAWDADLDCLAAISTTGVIKRTGAGTCSAGAIALTDIAGLGTGIATFLGTPTSANLASALTDETGTGLAVFNNGPTFLGTITAAAATFSGTVNFTGTFQVGGNTQTFPGVAATLAALNLADQTLSGGANVTTLALSTGNITIDCGARPLQSITNGGAFTITAPANDGSCILLVTNNASAAAISFSGFSEGSNTGDPLTTTNTNKFSIHLWRVGGTAGYRVAAHQ